MKRDENRLSDDILQRYYDDELSPAERAQVDANLDGEDRARLAVLGELHELLGAHHALETDGVDLSATIRAIEQSAPAPTAEPPPRRGRRSLVPVSIIGVFGAVAACVFMFFGPGRGVAASNEAEIESLEVAGMATVMRVQDGTDPAQTTTVIWASLDDDDDDNDEVILPTQPGEPETSDEKETL